MGPGVMDAMSEDVTAQAFDLGAWSQVQLQRTEAALSAWVGVNAPAGLGDRKSVV